MSPNRAGAPPKEDCVSNSAIAPFAVDLLSNWLRTRDKLQTELGRTPNADELINCEELARKQLTIFSKVLHSTRKKPGSFPLRSPEDTWTGAANETSWILQPVSRFSPVRILDLLAGLEPQSQLILALRFGLLGEAPMTLAGIANHLGLDFQAVVQHEAQALANLGGE